MLLDSYHLHFQLFHLPHLGISPWQTEKQVLLLTPTFYGASKCKHCTLRGGYDSFILLDSPGAKANDIMIYRYITDQKN